MRKTKLCCICGSAVSLSNFSKHEGSRKCLSGGKQTANPSKECRYCDRLFATPTGRGVHEVQCDMNPNYRKLNAGRVGWNRGMRSKPDTRNPEYVGKLGGYRPNAGRSKKFKVKDSYNNEVVLQSTFELRCSEILNALGIKWIRPKALKYDRQNYFADFYLPEQDIWLDPKNKYKAKQDREKIDKVIQQNNVRLFVILEHQLTEEYIGRLAEMD